MARSRRYFIVIIALLRALHRDERGQILPLFLFVFLGLTLLAIMIFNTGQQVSTRMEVQNAADAAALTQANWTARSLNIISMNNVAITQAFAVTIINTAAFIPLVEATAHTFEKATEYGEKLIELVQECAAALAAQPIGWAICGLAIAEKMFLDDLFVKLDSFEVRVKEPLRQIWSRDMGVDIDFQWPTLDIGNLYFKSLKITITGQFPAQKTKNFHYSTIAFSEMNKVINREMPNQMLRIASQMAVFNGLDREAPPMFYFPNNSISQNNTTKLPVKSGTFFPDLCLSNRIGRLASNLTDDPRDYPKYNKKNDQPELSKLSKLIEEIRENSEGLKKLIDAKEKGEGAWSDLKQVDLAGAVSNTFGAGKAGLEATTESVKQLTSDPESITDFVNNLKVLIASFFGDDKSNNKSKDPRSFEVSSEDISKIFDQTQFEDVQEVKPTSFPSDLYTLPEDKEYIEQSKFLSLKETVLTDVPTLLGEFLGSKDGESGEAWGKGFNLSTEQFSQPFESLNSLTDIPWYFGANFAEHGYQDFIGPFEKGRKSATYALVPPMLELGDTHEVFEYSDSTIRDNSFTEILDPLMTGFCGLKRLPGFPPGISNMPFSNKFNSLLEKIISTLKKSAPKFIDVSRVDPPSILEGYPMSIYQLKTPVPFPIGFLEVKVRNNWSILAITGKKQQGGIITSTLFDNPPNAVYAYAQAEVYNDTFYDLYTQNWQAKLVPARLLKDEGHRERVSKIVETQYPVLSKLLRKLDNGTIEFINVH